MRVLVATDSIGSLSSAEAGAAIASGWQRADPEAQLAVVALGESGAGFSRAVADHLGAEVELVSEPGAHLVSRVAADDCWVVAAEGLESPVPAVVQRGIDLTATSAAIGVAAREALRSHPEKLYLDLAGLQSHDGGAGILGALGGVGDRSLDHGISGLVGLTSMNVEAVRELVGDTELIAIVPSDEVGQHLLGLRGITSIRGRDANLDPAVMLSIDSTLERYAAALVPEASAEPGAGACGGAAYTILALGGRVMTGPQACAELVGLGETMNVAELVVTGSSAYDFGSRGGGVVQYIAEQAQKSLRPCIALAGDVVIGSREMRTMGIESAYSVGQTEGTPSHADRPTGMDVTAEQLSGLAARIANSWSW